VKRELRAATHETILGRDVLYSASPGTVLVQDDPGSTNEVHLCVVDESDSILELIVLNDAHLTALAAWLDARKARR